MQKFQLGLIAMLICCVAFVSCERTQKMMAPAEPTEDTMPADMTDMMDMMADYMSWKSVTLPAPIAFADATSPAETGEAHGMGTRTVYINEAGVAAQAAAQAAAMEDYPAGTMIVKEIMDATNTFVHRVATMTKTEDEMYAAHDYWMYTQSQRESADAELMPQAGDIPGGSSAGCHDCHAKATTDSVFVKLPAEMMMEMTDGDDGDTDAAGDTGDMTDGMDAGDTDGGDMTDGMDAGDTGDMTDGMETDMDGDADMTGDADGDMDGDADMTGDADGATGDGADSTEGGDGDTGADTTGGDTTENGGTTDDAGAAGN